MNIKTPPHMEFLYLMLKSVIQSNWLFSIFLHQLYQTRKWPSMKEKDCSIVLKCAQTFEHTRQSFCKTTIWLTNYSFTDRNLCLYGIWYHPLQVTTCMTSRKPPCLFCSHLTTPHHYTTEYCTLIPHRVKP
jgi:hypothetical protein